MSVFGGIGVCLWNNERLCRTGCEYLSWSPQFYLPLACQITTGLWTLSTVRVALQCTSPWCMYAWWDVIVIGNKAHRSPVYPTEVSFIYHTHAHSVPTLASSTSVCLSVILGRFCNCFWLSFLQEQKTKTKKDPTNQPIIHTNRTNTSWARKACHLYNSFEVFISYESSYEN